MEYAFWEKEYIPRLMQKSLEALTQ
jgi:hypothetical protein